MEENASQGREGFRIPFIPSVKPASLRRRIVFWNVVVLFCTLVLLSSAVYTLVMSTAFGNLDQRLRVEGARIQGLTRVYSGLGRPFDSAFFNDLVQEEKGDEFALHSPYIKLLDIHSGYTVGRSPNLGHESIPLNVTDFTAALHGQQIFRSYQDGSGRSTRLFMLPLRNPAQHVVLIAQVSVPLTPIEQLRNVLLLVLSIGTLFGTLIAYVVGFLLATRELRPLRALSITMRSLSTQGLGKQIPQRSAIIEVRLLTDAFNQMSERLEASFALQRDFVADISHELRTPLTTLRGQAEVLLLNPELEEDTREDVQNIRTELERLSRLVNNLLTNARAEAGMPPCVIEERAQHVELDSLLIEVARQSRFLDRQVSLEIGQFQQVSVPGDADLLKQLLFNIVDNALTYTSPGDHVYLDLACTQDVPDEVKEKSPDAQDKWAVIRIRDTGPGIVAADLPHIFERHYRAQRTSTRTPLGSGLGLSIASLIVEAHKGALTVESEPGKGTSFYIWLPTCKEL